MQIFFSETNATNYKNSIDNEIDEQFIQVFSHNVRVGPHLNDEQKDKSKHLLEQFPDLLYFDDTKVGRIKNYEYKINVKPNANPVHCSPSRVSFEQMQIIDKEIEMLESKGIVRPSKSSWCSRIVLVKRNDGRVRLCMDYRLVNDLIEFDSYPVPNVQLCIRTIGNKRYTPGTEIRLTGKIFITFDLVIRFSKFFFLICAR
jgi:hypothetical protein